MGVFRFGAGAAGHPERGPRDDGPVPPASLRGGLFGVERGWAGRNSRRDSSRRCRSLDATRPISRACGGGDWDIHIYPNLASNLSRWTPLWSGIKRRFRERGGGLWLAFARRDARDSRPGPVPFRFGRLLLGDLQLVSLQRRAGLPRCPRRGRLADGEDPPVRPREATGQRALARAVHEVHVRELPRPAFRSHDGGHPLPVRRPVPHGLPGRGQFHRPPAQGVLRGSAGLPAGAADPDVRLHGRGGRACDQRVLAPELERLHPPIRAQDPRRQDRDGNWSESSTCRRTPPSRSSRARKRATCGTCRVSSRICK